MQENHMHRVTLEDIARRTGYTINTVSRALRDKEDISLKTRIFIQATADQMGYVRNVMASSLRSGRTRTLGLILGGLENPWYALLANELNISAARNGYTIMLLCARDDPEMELRMAKIAIGYQMDGILLVPSRGSRMTLERMREGKIPFLVLAREMEGEAVPQLTWDDRLGGYMAAEHLIRKGRRHLGYYSMNEMPRSTRLREEGFHQACDEAGIPMADRRVSVASPLPMAQVLTSWVSEGLDGLCAFCDSEAWQAISVLYSQGVIVPEELGVVGFDNLQAGFPYPWPLCSVGFDMPAFAEKAIEMIRDRIGHFHKTMIPLIHIHSAFTQSAFP